jgi:hypothetical protein
VLGQERLLGGVVEVAGEQHPDVSELEAEHDRMPVDRVGGAQGTRLEVKVGERLTLQLVIGEADRAVARRRTYCASRATLTTQVVKLQPDQRACLPGAIVVSLPFLVPRRTSRGCRWGRGGR